MERRGLRHSKEEDAKEHIFEAVACSHVALRAKKAIGDAFLAKKCNAGSVLSLIENTGWAKQVRLAAYSSSRAPENSMYELDAVTVASEWLLAKRRGVGRLDESDGSRVLLEAIEQIETAPRAAACWGVVKLQLKTPRIEDLRLVFGELETEKRQYGVDDQTSRRFAEEWHGLGRRCFATGHVPIVKKYARRGVPPAMRPLVWRLLLGLPTPSVSPHHHQQQQHRGAHQFHFSKLEAEYYAGLLVFQEEETKAEATDNDDLLYLDDVKQSVSDSDYYFPFEESLSHVVLAFSRDRQHRLAAPHRGFVYYAAPLTFVFEREESTYFVLRAMYDAYWWKLNILSTDPETLLPLCRMFEQILFDHHPALVHHLAVRLQVKPLTVALPWIQHAFVTLLDVEQVLLLWDRILGFGTLRLLPVLAAAIFVFRSEQLLQATSRRDIDDVFQDCSMLKAVPLLQLFLWPDYSVLQF